MSFYIPSAFQEDTPTPTDSRCRPESLLVSFYIPSAFQEDTPTPTDSQVYIEERPGFEVAATKPFGGYPGDQEFGMRGAELYLLAEAAGLPVKDVPLWTAGYSGPGVIVNG